LIANLMGGPPEVWEKHIKAGHPNLEIRFWPDIGNPEDIEYLAFGKPLFDDLPDLPNLKIMMTRQAGVDGFVRHPRLPKVPLTKLENEAGDAMMTEYAIMHVLRLHRNVPAYKAQQAEKIWQEIPHVRPENRGVGFMGYGTMAKPPANFLASLGMNVAAWTRSPKPDAEVEIFHGPDQLEAFLNRSDIVVCLLPATNETIGILNAGAFAMLPKGASVINLGRGEHVVEDDLIAALDSGHLGGASLDTTAPEPLPQESPLWTHPKVLIMPHVARRPPLTQLVPQIIENIRRFEAGEPLLQEVDQSLGY
jgi:glyoxylate/hydroxypyruvate reductase A